MTDPVTVVDTIRGTGKKSVADSHLKHAKNQRHPDEADEDSVDISEEARERSAGRKRRSILDYLNDEPE